MEEIKIGKSYKNPDWVGKVFFDPDSDLVTSAYKTDALPIEPNKRLKHGTTFANLFCIFVLLRLMHRYKLSKLGEM